MVVIPSSWKRGEEPLTLFFGIRHSDEFHFQMDLDAIPLLTKLLCISLELVDLSVGQSTILVLIEFLQPISPQRTNPHD